MAILSKDGKYVTVQKNDTLSQIAEDYLGSWRKYQELASINNIPNPDIIYIGQVIYLNKKDVPGSSSSSSSSNAATITAFGFQSNSDNTLYAAWNWSKSNTENYEVMWYYHTGDGIWFIGSDSTTDDKQSTYSYPSNANKVKFKVKPVSKKRTVNDKETSYWTADWSTEKVYNISDRPPAEPGTPDVKIENNTITATLNNLEVYADTIQFQIVKDNATVFKTGTAKIVTNAVSYSCAVMAGSEYKVRARAVKNKTYSAWSDYSSNYGTGPAASSGITELKALSETSVHVEWGAVANAKTYEVQYTTKQIYFDTSTEVKTATVDATVSNTAIITGMESGKEYFFRVRAINSDGESAWTEIKSLVVGKDPVAPTTWSSTTTAIVGEPLNLYWIHNAQDGSSQTFAELELYIDDVKEEYTIENTRPEDEKDKTSVYAINTSEYPEGTKIQWRVRTAGITKTYGDWSVQRTIDIYASPTLELSVTDKDGNLLETLTSFPFYIYGLTGPNTQSPIGYHLSITSNEIYETVDNIGNKKIVNVGEAVYSKYFDIKDVLLVECSANNMNLENNISYKVTCTASMNSGLTVEESSEFTVAWAELECEINAEISIDKETVTASIRPYCESYQAGYYRVELGDEKYEVTEEPIDIYDVDNVYTTTGEIVYLGASDKGLHYCKVYTDDNGNFVEPKWHAVVTISGSYIVDNRIANPGSIEVVRTSTGEEVLMGSINGTTIYYCMVEKRTAFENVLLSVYRREFDGSFTELATGIDSSKQTFITDPHPALDFARYRVVGIVKDTGTVNYTDIPAYPVGEKAIIIQWDEAWSYFDTTNEDALEQPPWSGSLLRLPYNIDTSEGNSPDASLIEYIGRKHPVSYYGTQLGESATWNVDIDKKDEETIYALRRLKLWMGDVYVREPSGTGYWANIKVSFSEKHLNLVIPVTLTLTRVEGGM